MPLRAPPLEDSSQVMRMRPQPLETSLQFIHPGAPAHETSSQSMIPRAPPLETSSQFRRPRALPHETSSQFIRQGAPPLESICMATGSAPHCGAPRSPVPRQDPTKLWRCPHPLLSERCGCKRNGIGWCGRDGIGHRSFFERVRFRAKAMMPCLMNLAQILLIQGLIFFRPRADGPDWYLARMPATTYFAGVKLAAHTRPAIR